MDTAPAGLDAPNRKGHVGRTLRDPRFSQMLASLGIPSEHLAETEKFARSLAASQARWVVGRSGLFSARRLTKADANRALKHELAKLAGAGVE